MEPRAEPRNHVEGQSPNVQAHAVGHEGINVDNQAGHHEENSGCQDTPVVSFYAEFPVELSSYPLENADANQDAINVIEDNI